MKIVERSGIAEIFRSDTYLTRKHRIGGSKIEKFMPDNLSTFIPLNWADWEADEYIQDMNETREGIYFSLVRELWKFDMFECNHSRLAERIQAGKWNLSHLQMGTLEREPSCPRATLRVTAKVRLQSLLKDHAGAKKPTPETTVRRGVRVVTNRFRAEDRP